jgi:predicted TIM-barrel fold metal-dependent hydrolase
MVKRIHQQAAAFRVVQQIVLQVGVALHHPDVAQHLVQHAGRAAGAALVAQLVQRIPGPGAQQADDDFAVGQRGVVVGNFPDALVRVRLGGGTGHQVLDRQGSVHRQMLPQCSIHR